MEWSRLLLLLTPAKATLVMLLLLLILVVLLDFSDEWRLLSKEIEVEESGCDV